MSLYIFISDHEMIDASQIQHLQYDEGKLTINFMSSHVVTYEGPHAVRVLKLIRKRIDREDDLYDKNAALIEGSYERMKREEEGPNIDDMGFGDLGDPDWLNE